MKYEHKMTTVDQAANQGCYVTWRVNLFCKNIYWIEKFSRHNVQNEWNVMKSDIGDLH